VALKDLTGFNGRADAVLFSNDENFTPPADATFEERTTWKIPGVPSAIEDAGEYDLVVVGGGYGGLGAAISAARMGAKVALIQNRNVLG
jgi:NADPH-dependent 2,4-dienoyl-CoA reductase/sulfur reductase-like enzyme